MDEKIQNGDDGVSGDPVERLAATRHEFGEHGVKVAASTTFTVLEAGTMPEIFQGRLGPDEVVVFSMGVISTDGPCSADAGCDGGGRPGTVRPVVSVPYRVR